MSTAFNIPAGFALVPMHMTDEMEAVTHDDSWQWEDLLAAAGAVTEAQYDDIAAGRVAQAPIAPTPSVGAMPGEPVAWRHGLLFDGKVIDCAVTFSSTSPFPDSARPRFAHVSAPLYLAASVASRAGSEPVGLSPMQEPKYTVNGSAIVNRASGEAIPADEPVFIFRARDKLAVSVLDFYSMKTRDGQHYAAVRKRMKHFRQFASRYPERMKAPDTAPIAPAAAAEPHQLSNFVRSDDANRAATVARAGERIDAMKAAEPSESPWFGVEDEVSLTRAVSVMNDVLTDISGWEDRALAEAVESSKVDLCAMIECIRMRADASYVPGSKPIDGESVVAPC